MGKAASVRQMSKNRRAPPPPCDRGGPPSGFPPRPRKPGGPTRGRLSRLCAARTAPSMSVRRTRRRRRTPRRGCESLRGTSGGACSGAACEQAIWRASRAGSAPRSKAKLRTSGALGRRRAPCWTRLCRRGDDDRLTRHHTSSNRTTANCRCYIRFTADPSSEGGGGCTQPPPHPPRTPSFACARLR